jgi:hypothetical protein
VRGELYLYRHELLGKSCGYMISSLGTEGAEVGPLEPLGDLPGARHLLKLVFVFVFLFLWSQAKRLSAVG